MDFILVGILREEKKLFAFFFFFLIILFVFEPHEAEITPGSWGTIRDAGDGTLVSCLLIRQMHYLLCYCSRPEPFYVLLTWGFEYIGFCCIWHYDALGIELQYTLCIRCCIGWVHICSMVKQRNYGKAGHLTGWSYA